MPADDADRLGPKGHVYVELVREQWRAPLERCTARRALPKSALGVAPIVFGIVGTFAIYGEARVMVGIGLMGLVSSFREISALRPEFEEARRWAGSLAGDVVSSVTLRESDARGPIAAGDDCRDTVTFPIPAAAEPSFYSSTASVRWTLTMELVFDGAAPWRRAWPMLVFTADSA